MPVEDILWTNIHKHLLSNYTDKNKMKLLEPLEKLEGIQDQSSKQKTQIVHLRTRKNIAI